MEGSTVVKLKTSDGVQFDCSLSTLKHMKYFQDFLEGRDTVDEVLDMTDLKITEPIMKKLFEFTDLLSKYTVPRITKPIKHGSIFEVTSPVFAQYTETLDDEQLCEMIMVADRLNIQPL